MFGCTCDPVEIRELGRSGTWLSHDLTCPANLGRRPIVVAEHPPPHYPGSTPKVRAILAGLPPDDVNRIARMDPADVDRAIVRALRLDAARRKFLPGLRGGAIELLAKSLDPPRDARWVTGTTSTGPG